MANVYHGGSLNILDTPVEQLQQDVPTGFLGRLARRAKLEEANAQPEATPEGVASAMIEGIDTNLQATALGMDDDQVYQQLNREAQAQEESVAPITERIAKLKATTLDRNISSDEIPFANRPTRNMYERSAKVAKALADVKEIKFDEDTGEAVFETTEKKPGDVRLGVQDTRILEKREGWEEVKPRPLVRALSNLGIYDERLGSMIEGAGEVGSLVVENMMMQSAYTMEVDESDPGAQPQLVEKDLDEVNLDKNDMAAANLSSKIGREFSREIQRLTGKETTDPVNPDDAAVIGDALLRTYAAVNPDMITYIPPAINSDNKQATYRPTALGAQMINSSNKELKRIFPKYNFRPLNSPDVNSAQGEARHEVKSQTGNVGKIDFEKTISKAMYNLSTIPNVVDRKRLELVIKSVLPLLQVKNSTEASAFNQIKADPMLLMYATMFNMGTKKYQKLLATKEKLKREADSISSKVGTNGVTVEDANEAYQKYMSYDPDAIYNKGLDDLAQSVFTAVQESGGAKYLTYYMQNFSGRIAPQQTMFDPTSNKLIRFVTRNATPVAIRKGSRQHRNIKQMYSMMLVDGADVLLPKAREEALANSHKKLYGWGKVLRKLMDQSGEVSEISKGIGEGKPLSQLGQLPMLLLDPTIDGPLIEAIMSKGEDGPHFIDGLIDYANYYETVVEKGLTYNSFFNAYIDGKTNGLASNALMMGDKGIASRSGVLRKSTTNLLDEGDVRDQLKSTLLYYIDNRGIEYNFDGMSEEDVNTIYKLATDVVSTRELNKYITMTYGYGRDPESFTVDVGNTILDVEQAYLAQGLQSPLTNLDFNKVAVMINRMYGEAISEIFGANGIAAKPLMKAAAVYAALNNNVLKIKGPTGLDLIFGGKIMQTYEEAAANAQKYGITFNEDTKASEGTAIRYQAVGTSAAVLGKNDVMARSAMNGSVVAPVQAVDAATVALSLSGRSFERLYRASNGKPYIHTIYDAFKMDANGYDVVLEEVNKNWMQVCKDYNYIEEAYKANVNNVSTLVDKLDMLIADGNKVINWDKPPGSRDYAMFKEMMLNSKFLAKVLKQTLHPDTISKYEAEAEAKGFNKASALKGKAAYILGYAKNAGFNPDEPSIVTPVQLKAFLNGFTKEVNGKRRMRELVSKIERDKEELFKMINPEENYQYYSH